MLPSRCEQQQHLHHAASAPRTSPRPRATQQQQQQHNTTAASARRASPPPRACDAAEQHVCLLSSLALRFHWSVLHATRLASWVNLALGSIVFFAQALGGVQEEACHGSHLTLDRKSVV